MAGPKTQRRRMLTTALLAALLLSLAAGSARAVPTWTDEADMVNGTIGRGTFVFDAGQHNYISRQALLQAPLAGYYNAAGFDANFRT